MRVDVVVKVGGGEGIELDAIVVEVAELIRTGLSVVLVHGGSHETNMLSLRLGHPAQFITSPSGHTSRRTDRQTLDTFCMAYCGLINKRVVESLRAQGIDAVGLSGIDGGIWEGQRKTAIRSVEDGQTVIIRDDLSGRVTRVNTDLLDLLLESGRTPVLTPPAVTAEGVAINVDADRAAAMTAGALHARELLLLSNVPGVLRDIENPASVIGSAAEVGMDVVREAGAGRMKNKILAAEEALAQGVGRVVIGSAKGAGAIERARQGAGTVFEGALA